MATNKVSSGDRISVVKAGVKAGDVVVIGNLKGVALIDTNANGETVIETRGVFVLPVLASGGGYDEVIFIGDNIFVDSDGNLDMTSSNLFFGIALETAQDGIVSEIRVMVV